MEEKKISNYQEAVSCLKRSHFKQNLAVGGIKFLTAWSFCYGIVVILLRQLRFNTNFKAWAICGVPLAFFYALDFAIKNSLSAHTAVAAIDAHNKAGGLLLAENETGDTSWRAFQKKVFTLPKIKFNDDPKEIGVLLLSLAFLVASFWIPLIDNSYRQRKIDLNHKVTKIEEQIELLENENIITSEESQSLYQVLEEIVENSDREAPGITFEAMEQLENRLRHEAASELKKRITDGELLKKLESFAKEISKNSESEVNSAENKNSPTADELLSSLKNILRQAGLDENQISEFLKQQFGKNTAKEGLSENSLEHQFGNKALNSLSESQIASYAQQLEHNMRQKMMETQELARKLVEKGLKKGEEGQGKGEEGQGKGEEGQGKGEEGNSGVTQAGTGNGGIDGGIAAPLTFGDKASDYNAKFHDETLPDIRAGSLNQSIAVGMGAEAPRQEAIGTSESSASKIGISKTRNTFKNKLILPKYRNAVKNYFEN